MSNYSFPMPGASLEPQGKVITKGLCYAASVGWLSTLAVCGSTVDAQVGEVMSELLALAGFNVMVTVAFAAFIWRNQVQAERRNDAAHADLSRRIDHLAESVESRIDGLTVEVSGLGQRLAPLEGWIEGQGNLDRAASPPSE